MIFLFRSAHIEAFDDHKAGDKPTINFRVSPTLQPKIRPPYLKDKKCYLTLNATTVVQQYHIYIIYRPSTEKQAPATVFPRMDFLRGHSGTLGSISDLNVGSGQ